MGKLTDIQIRAWIKSGERFEQRADGDGLYLSYRETFAMPKWLFRYRFQGRQRVMSIGSYSSVSLAKAREAAKELAAKVALGHDVAGEKQERKREAIAKIEAEKAAWTVARLCDEFFERVILPRWKHSNIVRSRIENDIKPSMGKMKAEDVKPRDVDAMLQQIIKRGAPTVANDVLRWTKRIFDFAIKRHVVLYNPASAFDIADAGGKEEARDRWLTREEITQLFQAMREMLGRFSIENMHAVRLLLLLAVRKEELVAAPWSEFDLAAAVWHLPEERTKTSSAIDIPLPPLAVETLRELHRLANGSAYVFPARKMQHRMIPHIDLNTLNAALSKHIKPKLKEVPNFTIHDFRRTARTHLAALGVDPFVAERCLNHKVKGVEGIYNRHDYFDERRAALNKWAELLKALEEGRQDYNVVPLRAQRSA
ncbi:tyrosine-type recombinase/integrase [Dechloromonas agitata]|uniref:tyrosine-type recombinase/integrase n=1 Tax=Dechloromonas agitata TaxID=73030 RepID=UPI00237EC2CD|nr:site-specific integrase [Dechloromonas agitata]MDE1546296.1 tyrosine-type recombinase/integrase [Dechloromonas agitata]